MNFRRIIRRISRLVLPGGLYKLLVIAFRIDINETLSPVQLRHVRRYEFGQEHSTGSKMLDAACGTGYGSDLLEPFEEYVGVDYADYCIDYADTNFKRPNRRFIRADIMSLEEILGPSSFNTIVSFETLEHLDNPGSVLKIFMRLLVPDGRLILSIPLNHPDTVYHKRKYSHEDVKNMFAELSKEFDFTMDEYLQSHLKITKLTTLLSSETKGTWLGVILKVSA